MVRVEGGERGKVIGQQINHHVGLLTVGVGFLDQDEIRVGGEGFNEVHPSASQVRNGGVEGSRIPRGNVNRSIVRGGERRGALSVIRGSQRRRRSFGKTKLIKRERRLTGLRVRLKSRIKIDARSIKGG